MLEIIYDKIWNITKLPGVANNKNMDIHQEHSNRMQMPALNRQPAR